MKGLFITGTDTGVGKTFVTAAMARQARSMGKKVFAFKPIETGCSDAEGADQRLLVEAAGEWQTGEYRGVYRFHMPVAPLVAAEAEKIAIDLDRVVRIAKAGAGLSDLALVEGAGGWRVPLTPNADIGAFARRLGWPVVLVARATLGTINHTLLSIEAIERDGLDVEGIVLSRRAEDAPELCQSSAHEIGRRWPGRVLVLEDGGTRLDVLWS